MKTAAITAILVALTCGALNPSQSVAQDKKGMSHDHMMMANEPHHVLVMAYHQNLLEFTKALQEQTAHASTVNVEFARDAVTEMRRSCDQIKQHHQEHMQTMSAEMHTKMSAMMKQMETYRTEMNTQLEALEAEVRLDTPDVKKVSTLATSVHTHLDAMARVHQGGKGSKMSEHRYFK